MRVPYNIKTVTNELRMRDERPWAVGFGKEYISIAGISYMYSIEREALVEPRIWLMSSEVYRDRYGIEHCFLCCSQSALFGGPICKVDFAVASRVRSVDTAKASFNDCW